MATGTNPQDPANLGPSHNYPSPGAAHMPQGSYYDHRGQRPFDDDDELHLANSLSQNIGAQLANAGAMSNGHSHGHEQEMAVSPAGAATSAGMAPPQTPTQPPQGISGVSHVANEGNQDTGTSGDGTRRKRSKVSRACDECRRKKVCTNMKEMSMRGC